MVLQRTKLISDETAISINMLHQQIAIEREKRPNPPKYIVVRTPEQFKAMNNTILKAK